MEGIDMSQDAPDDMPNHSEPASPAIEDTARGDSMPMEEQSAKKFEGDTAPPHREPDRSDKFASPGRYAILVAVVLLSAFLGYSMAVRIRRAMTAAQPQRVVHLDDDGVTGDIVVEEEPDGVGDEDASLSTDDDVPDEEKVAEAADTETEAAEEEEADDVDPLESAPAVADAEEVNDGADILDAEEDSKPFALDAVRLSEAYRDSGISAFRCRMALRDFVKAIASANAEAVTNRADMLKTVAKYLKNGMDKAQAAGDLERVVAFRAALETADGKIEGELEEIAKLRTARDAQKARIDKALLAKGAAAARTLYDYLEVQKKETTKKGDFAEAKKIAAFQKQVEEWTKMMKSAAQGESAGTRAASATDTDMAVSTKTQQESTTGKSGRPLPATDDSWSRPYQKAVETEAKSATIDARSASSRTSNLTLSGTQTEVSVTLAKTALPHVIRDQYLVPQGKELIVEAGATIIFEKEASLYCEGTLMMNGTEKAPIACKGHMPKVGYWNSITVKSHDSSIEFVQVTDAKIGITTVNSPSVRNCVFAKNEIGIKLGERQRGQSFENCLITDNVQCGVDAGFSSVVLFKRCTIEDNGGWGIRSTYHYGTVNLEKSKITNNHGGGIHLRRGGSHANAKDCIIMDNNSYDVENACDDDTSWNLRQNYWGPSVTRLLQQRGDGANLPNIKDGRDTGRGNIVDVAEFLTEPPKDCGATVKW